MDWIIRRAVVMAACLALVPAGAQAKSKSKEEAQVQCKDGTTSKAGRGACSHHGGVSGPASSAEDTKPTKSAKASSSSSQEGTEVRCKDGTTSRAGRGACSHHGGVATASDDAKADKESRSAQDTQRDESQAAPRGRAPASTMQRAPPAGQPTARCKDGTLSYSQHRSGTCSRHGGVAQWLGQ